MSEDSGVAPDSAAAGFAGAGRRQLLLGLSSILVCPRTAMAGVRSAEAHSDYGGPLPPMRHMGVRHPSHNEQDRAAAILDAAPVSTPLAIMEYFEGLRATNRDGEFYNAGWKTRWNPVIVAFFRETATKPSGDTTSWCAAFLNWCLHRAGDQGGTGSASSGSFRTVAGRTHHPQPGDVVVFGDIDPVGYRQGRGHVGLFLERRGDRILVLGGNQKNRFGHQAVCRKWLGQHDTTYGLALHSFHSMRALV